MRRSNWRSKFLELLTSAATSEGVAIQAQSPEDRRLAVLLCDYEMTREDDRTLANIQAAFFALAVALIAALISIVKDACQFQDPAVVATDPTSCDRIPNAMLAFAPIVPLIVIGFIQAQGALATLRSYYQRALEDELRTYAAEGFQSISGLGPASYIEFVTTFNSLRRGRRSYRTLVALLLLAILCIFGGFIVYIAHALSSSYQIAMGVFYGAGALFLLAENLYVSVGGRGFFASMLVRYSKATRHGGPDLPQLPQSRSGPERSLYSYLILPRPEDWVKWLFFPISFLLALLAVGGTTNVQILQAAIFFLILEYLLYEARYQWNDIRGFVSDQKHPFRHARRRLPGPNQRAKAHITWSAITIGARLGAVFLLAYLTPQLRSVIWVAIALVLGPAVIYEMLRKDKGKQFDLLHPTTEAFFIWIFVGIGYAVRGTFGLYFGVSELDPLPVFVLWGISLWAFGTMVVTLTWALEAAAYCHRRGEQWEYVPDLEDKHHLAVLLNYLDLRPRAGPPVSKPSGAHERVLEPRHQTVAPWNISLCVASCGAGALGTALSYRFEPPIASMVMSATLGLGLALLLTICNRSWQRWLLTLAGAGLLVSFALWLGAPVAYLAATPWLLCAGFYAFFRQVSYADLKAGLKPALHTVQLTLRALARIAIGPSTWEFLTRTQPSVETFSSDRPSRPARQPPSTPIRRS